MISLRLRSTASCGALACRGFRALVAGGAVRDDLLGLDPKDFDIEVYGDRLSIVSLNA